jgi:hypothetical protein
MIRSAIKGEFGKKVHNQRRSGNYIYSIGSFGNPDGIRTVEMTRYSKPGKQNDAGNAADKNCIGKDGDDDPSNNGNKKLLIKQLCIS